MHKPNRAQLNRIVCSSERICSLHWLGTGGPDIRASLYISTTTTDPATSEEVSQQNKHFTLLLILGYFYSALMDDFGLYS